jgi:Fur family ferric uptake transcriptional regulator/Fur family peroxide stress response transcriptional regulator
MKKLAIEYLTDNGIKPSIQRVAIMEYLMKYRSHPTADEIYLALSPEMPTLSKTTVYNTLRLFVDQGAAIMLTIDERNANFDADTTPHAHFYCRRCTRIYDLPIDAKKMLASTCIEDGFKLEDAALYIKGVCKDCQNALPS